MENESHDLKKLAHYLHEMADRLLDLLAQAGRQAARSSDAKLRHDGQEWAKEAAENVFAYRTRLESALHESDPKKLSHAANLFAALGRYVNDYDYSWFDGHRDLAGLVAAIHKTAAAIVLSIRTFDPANLERNRRALM